ncbi:MAG TPA: DUF2341 domain-containing protein, partial [Chitinispirillaceae bacterium]|nr:DUF2341 domain-containing protein [Chitinispirillaceae bacterium]
MKRFRSILCFFLPALFTLSLCSDDYNPFSDADNCDMHFIEQSFNPQDTLTIFSTETVTVRFTAPSFVKSFTVRAKKNRYFNDSAKTLLSPGGGPHRLLFSFRDTGTMNISFHLEKTTGEIVEKEINCYVKSPLENSIVNGGFDSHNKQTFKTGRVSDPDVIYQWFFGKFGQVDLLSAETTGLFIDGISETGYGTVKITDKIYFSPADTFVYSFNDIYPPKLKFLDQGEQNGDTLICSGEALYKKIQIIDPGCGIVNDVRINGRSETEKEIIFKKFLPGTGVIEIYLRDGSINHNDTTLRYFVKVDSGRVVHDGNLQFKILPNEDTITVNTPFFNMFTHVEYLDQRILNHQINVFVNEQIAGSITLSGISHSYDPFNVSLINGINSVVLELFDKTLKKSADTLKVAVFYDPDYKIDKKPNFVDVRFVNTRFSRGKVIITGDSLDLKVVVFDDKGKVKAVLAKNDTLFCEKNDYQWGGRIPVDSDSLKIIAIDSAGQVTDTIFKVVKNKIPLIKRPIVKRVQLVAGSIFTAKIAAEDPDGDMLRYNVIESEGKDILIDQNGTIQWTTTTADVNNAGFLFKFSISDDYDEIMDSLRVIVLKDSSDAIIPVHFMTKPSDVFSEIESGLTYKYTLQFLSRPDSVYYNLKTDMDSAKVINDTLILKPQLTDTGYQRLTLVVANLMEESDSLFLDFTVHEANRKPVIKADSSMYKDGIPGISVTGSIDSFMTYTLRIDDPDITDKNVLKTGVRSHFSNAKIQLVAGIDNKYELLLYNQNNIEGEDTLTVFCEDHGGLVDTVKIPVHYTLKVYPVKLLFPSEGENIQSDSVLFKWTTCNGNDISYVFQIGQSQDSTVKSVIVKDTLLHQVIKKSDTYRWRIITGSARDTAYGQWHYFSLHSQSHIQFKTTENQIKKYCFADVDTYSLRFEIKEGTGSLVNKFSAEIVENAKTKMIPVTSSGVLTWIPTVNDTGVYTLNAQVVDSNGNADTLQSSLSVVPATGCHINLSCSDEDLYSDGAIDLYGQDNETKLIIKIDRSRRSLFDTFNILVKSNGYSVNVDADSAIIVLQRPLQVITDDTLDITVRNKSGNVAPGTEKVIVRYNVPKKRVIIGTGTLSLTEGLSDIPVLIRLDRRSIGFTKKCGFRFLVNDKNDTLKYQVNSWKQNNKTAEVWVLFDTITSTGNSACIMEYGYQVPDRSDGKLIFDTLNHFGAVYHFEGLNDKGAVVQDETPAANNGTFLNNKYDIVNGIGSGITFREGVNNQISLEKKITIGNTGEKTVVFESWVKMVYSSSNRCLFSINVDTSLQCNFSANTGLLKVGYVYRDTDGSQKFGDGDQDAPFT